MSISEAEIFESQDANKTGMLNQKGVGRSKGDDRGGGSCGKTEEKGGRGGMKISQTNAKAQACMQSVHVKKAIGVKPSAIAKVRGTLKASSYQPLRPHYTSLKASLHP